MANYAVMTENKLTGTVITVIVAIIVIGVVLIPIVNGLTTTTEIIDVPGDENTNPVGDLRLAYSEDTSLTLDLTISVSGGSVSITGDYSASGLTDDQILIGSDNYSVIIQNGALIESIDGVGSTVTSVTIAVSGGEINDVPYTFLYYPSSDGTYANYQSWEYDIGASYAVGSFAGVTVQSKDGTITDSNPYGFVADVQTEGDITTGVNYNIPSEQGSEEL